MSETQAVFAPQVALEIRTLFARLFRRFREMGADGSLTPSQASALARISKSGISTVSALAAAEKVRPQSMAATVDALETADLVTRSQDPGDGRRQLVELTSRGRARIRGQREAGAAWLDETLSERTTPEELRTISAAIMILDRVFS